MAPPTDQPGPAETMMAGDAASRMLGIELVAEFRGRSSEVTEPRR
jgi:hypothetical protein